MTLSSSPTQSPCILRSKVSDYFRFGSLESCSYLVCSALTSIPVDLRNMGILPEISGEEICHWEEWRERAHWTYIWLRLWWSEGLGWEDKRVRTVIPTWILWFSFILASDTNFPSPISKAGLSSGTSFPAGTRVGPSPSPHTTLWCWAAV